MKKILFLMMALCGMTAAMAQTLTEVATFEELKAAIDAAKYDNGTKSNAKIKLTADICLDGMQGTLVNTFTGEIDGDYMKFDPDEGKDVHASRVIYGGKQAFEKDNKEQKLCSKLFENVEGAKIQNLMFYKIRIQDDSNNYLGLIARHAKDTEFGNIVADSISVFCDEDYAGTLVGEADHCKFAGIMTDYCDVTVDGKGAGGMVGISKNCEYFICISNKACSVFADGSNWTNDGISGGIVGDSSHDNFSACVNYAMVGADQCCLGGIAGQCEYSDFIHCINSGAVYHCDSDDFKEACDKQRAAFKSVTREQIAAAAAGVASSMAVIGGAVVAFATITKVATAVNTASTALFVHNTGVTGFLFQCHAVSSVMVHASGPAFPAQVSVAGAVVGLWPVVAVVAAIAVATVTYEIMIGDDEVGGITGQARGGVFESCTNTGFLGCKDDNLGGIVGLGYGVTINNCLNTAWFNIDEDDTTGSIIGKVDLDNENNGKKCKITNCLSTARLKIVGDYHTDWNGGRIDATSGNNYVRDSEAIDGDTDDPSQWEMRVNTEELMSGRIARWLNNGYENRIAGVKPWRQNLYHIMGYQGKNWDENPVTDITHSAVSIDDLKVDFEIVTAQDLIDFSTSVNNGNQFAVAVLTADIDMTGKDWTPIGKDETNKHFRGMFDGNGHTIKGLKYNGSQAAGLFGAVHAGAEIRNVIIGDDCEFTTTGDLGAGAIVGTADINWKWGNVVVENCGNYGNVNGKNNAGGIFGRMKGDMGDAVKAFVHNCFNMGTITAVEGNSGLIGGYMRDNAVVTNCWSIGKLVSSTWEKPFDAAHNEFFAGYNNNIEIKNCYAIDLAEGVMGATADTEQKGVSNQTMAVLASGEIAYNLNDSTNKANDSIVWQQNLGTDAHPVFGTKGIYHTRTVSEVSKGYGTVCLPYALKSDKDICYYTFCEKTEDDGTINLHFEYADSIPAGTPALFFANVGDVAFGGVGKEWATAPVVPASAPWQFVGTYTQQVFSGTQAETIYYVSSGSIKNAKKTTIAPYRAYFEGPSISSLTASGAKSIIFTIEDEDGSVTALRYINENQESMHNTESIMHNYYNLNGQRVGANHKGIVIHYGKKSIQ